MHPVIWFQVFQFNENNWHTVLWNQVFLSNANNLHNVVSHLAYWSTNVAFMQVYTSKRGRYKVNIKRWMKKEKNHKKMMSERIKEEK